MIDVRKGDLFENELRGAVLALYAWFVSMAYALPYYRNRIGGDFETYMKPFVFRQLSIKLIEFLQSVGLSYETAALILIATSGAFFFFALLFMIRTSWGASSTTMEVLALLLLAGFMMVFQKHTKPYDLATAFFFTLALTFMARWNLIGYLLTFTLSCINKETTILLLPVFMVYYWRRMKPVERYWVYVLAQVLIFVDVQVAIRHVFGDAPGVSVWFSPAENIQAYGIDPLRSLIHVAVIGVVLWLVVGNWQLKPIFLRTAFVIMVPVLGLLYIVAGQAFEYRVFAECFSVTALLAIQGVKIL